MATSKVAGKTGELWQGYEEDGEPITTSGISMSQAAKGALHGSSNLWIYRVKNGRIQLLLQRRAAESVTWPNFFDVSAAGHINFNETPLVAALRETKEELGLDIMPETVRLLFLHRQELHYDPNKIIENELQWVYGYDVTRTPHFSLEPSEVMSIRWVSMGVFSRLIAGNVKGAHIVPHNAEYFAELQREIQELASEIHGYQSAG